MSWLIEESSVLILPGISLQDIIVKDDYDLGVNDSELIEVPAGDDEPLPEIKEEEVAEQVEKPVENKEEEPIPQYFTTKDKWVQKTNLLCWYCSNNFKSMPWFIPIQLDTSLVTTLDEMKEVEIFHVYGNFCCPCCAKSYLEFSHSTEFTNKWQCKELLKKLFQMIYDIKVEIPLAEDPRKMKKYCGSIGITCDEYAEINEKKISSLLKK